MLTKGEGRGVCPVQLVKTLLFSPVQRNQKVKEKRSILNAVTAYQGAKEKERRREEEKNKRDGREKREVLKVRR